MIQTYDINRIFPRFILQDKNGYAIYGTRPLYPYCEGNVRYTQSKDGKHRYAITLTEEAPYSLFKRFGFLLFFFDPALFFYALLLFKEPALSLTLVFFLHDLRHG